jgi:hypothetical protein
VAARVDDAYVFEPDRLQIFASIHRSWKLVAELNTVDWQTQPWSSAVRPMSDG